MTTRYVLLLTSLLLLAPAAMADNSPGDENLETKVSLLVGRPGEIGDARGTLVVPGTVIPSPDTSPAVRGDWKDEQLASSRLVHVAEGLQKTLRLSDVEVIYGLPMTLEVGQVKDLPPPSSESNVRISVELLGYNDQTASYEVQFFERSTVIADTKVAATRGQRAVVGGVNGADAPYLFLVIEPSAGATARYLEGDGEITPPRVIEKVQPTYPEDARQDRISGTVILQTIVTAEGAVRDVKVLSDKTGRLAEAAAEAVRQWRFEPALLDGVPVDVYYNLTVNFRLAKKKTEEGEP